MKVLVICDDVWHPVEVIKRGLSLVEDKDLSFDYIMDAKDILTEEMIREYPVIINCKSNSITAANSEPWFEKTVTEVGPMEFRKYVEEGGGFLALHAGNVFFEGECPEYTDFVGNCFVTHPLRCEVTVYPVEENLITKGVAPFTERDEHYELGKLASDIHPFLMSKSETGGTQIAGYTRDIGKGHVCILTPGHTLSVYQNKNYRKLIRQAIIWCNGGR